MDNSINFKAAIVLKQPNTELRNGLLQVIGKHKQCFNNFTREGDVLYITRNSANKRAAEFLTKAKEEDKTLKFEFYPELSTKSGFDDELPEEAKKILAQKGNIILKTVNSLKKYFKIGVQNTEKTISKDENSFESCMEAIKRELGIDINECTVKRKNGYVDLYDRSSHKYVGSISGPDKYRFRYAKIKEKNSDDMKRYAIIDGKIEFTYKNDPELKINGTKTFLSNFRQAAHRNAVYS